MPSRKLVHPSSNRQNRKLERKNQASFVGIYEDEPANTIPQNTLAKAINCICKGNSVEPRNGTRRYTDLVFPAIEGRTGYAAHKVITSNGAFIVSDSGDIFSEDDVSNLFGWDNGLYDEITGYISPTRVRVRDSDENTGTNCFVRGRLNLWNYHSKRNVWVIQLGREFYTADIGITNLTKVIIFSRSLPNNTFSDFKEFDEDCLINNSGGLFKILLEKNPPTAYRVNTDIPTQKILSNQAQGDRNHKYRYFYSMSYIDENTNFSNRNTPSKIQTESGLNAYNYENVEEGDWSIINTEEPIGRGVETYGILNGGTLIGDYVDPLYWSAITNATCRFNFNQLGFAEVIFDFSNATTMNDIAQIIQNNIQVYFPFATCEYVSTGGIPRLQLTSGKEQEGSVSICQEGVGGTPSGDDLGFTVAGGATTTSHRINKPKIVRGLTVPLYNGVSDTWQWHWNRYSVYRTADYGPDGLHLKTNGIQTVNSPDFIVWVKDLRVSASFIARRVNGIIEVRAGEYGQFEKADEGSVVEFEDGARFEIVENGYIDEKHVRYSDGDYYRDVSPWQAACIGNGRVARVDKNGRIITRHPGSVGTAFTVDDVRKPIVFPNGAVSYIKRFVSANSVEVYDTVSWTETAITLDPTYRNFNDVVSDSVLYGYSTAWTSKNRLFVPLKISNIVSIQPGFLLTAASGDKEIRYCQLELSYRQFAGYHNYEYQKIVLEDVIIDIHDFPDRYSALCERTIYTGVTNNSFELTVESTLQKIFQLNDPEKVADFGMSNAGSKCKIGKGVIRFVTNLNEVIDFDGFNYGEDLTTDKEGLRKFRNAIRKSVKRYASVYSRETGYLLWWVKNN